jgi:hypothetical protein
MWCSGGSKPQVDGGKVLAKWASYDLLGPMRQLGTIPDPRQDEARVPEDLAILIFGLDAAGILYAHARHESVCTGAEQ